MEPERRASLTESPKKVFNRFKGAVRKIGSVAKERYAARTHLLVFVPGALFLAMGFALLIAPSVFIGLMSGLLLYVGILAIYGGLKVRQLHHRFRDVIKQVETRVYIRGANFGENPEANPRHDSGSKKIVYH